jgi:hypothetical protein
MPEEPFLDRGGHALLGRLAEEAAIAAVGGDDTVTRDHYR